MSQGGSFVGRILPQGYTVRHAETSDARALAALINSVDESLGSTPWVTEADIVEDYGDPDLDVAAHTWVVERGSRVAAYAELWKVADEDHEPVDAQGWVAPTDRGRGLGTFLVDTYENAALERARSVGRKRILLRSYFPGPDDAARAVFAGRGYSLVRHFWHMWIDLNAVSPAPPPVPAGLTLRTLDADADARALHEMIMAAFEGHWGWTPASFENFWRRVSGREDFDPTLSLLVFERDRLIAASINVLKLGEGWVNELGVLKEARGRGIGELLLRHSFALFKRRGLPAAALGVDAGNETGAVRLYERVGMRSIRSFDSYEKEIPV